MTVSKSILTFSTLAFALIFGGGVYVFTHLNALAKPFVERIASDSLGVKVTIGGMDISLQEKRVGVSDIRIANPSGYSRPYAVTIENASVALNNVAEKLIDFKDITVDGTQVFVEVKEGSTNLHTLKKGIKGGDAAKAEEADPLKVMIRRFALSPTQVNPTITLVSEKDLDPVTVAPIVLTGIGVKENGILAREAVAQVMRPLFEAFSDAAGSAGFYQGLSPDVLKEMGMSDFDQLKTNLKEDIGNLGDSVKSLFD